MYKTLKMNTVFLLLLFVNISLGFVVKDKPKRISEQKCEEFAKHSTFNANEYQTFNCSLRYHELVRQDRLGVNPAEFRHLAKIYAEDNSKKILICNGALISEQYVLTSAQCVSDKERLPAWVRLGDTDSNTVSSTPTTQDFFITEIHPHPLYSPPSPDNNLALLRLDEAAVLSPQYVIPACLHAEDDVQELPNALLAGWGYRQIDAREDYDVDDEVKPAECGKAATKMALDQRKVLCTESQICEWMQLKTGAPLQIEREDMWCMHDLLAINVLEKGYTCTDNAQLNLNVKIYDYLDWIESVVWSDKD